MINWLNQVTTANMLPGMPLPDGEIFDWITSHCIFREWLSAKKSASLLVYGSPGSGSTEFTAYALDCFRMHLQRSSVLMLSFGFDGRSEQRQSGPTLVHSLLSQILSAKPAVLRHTQQLIQSVFEHSPPSEEQLWNLLQTLITHPEDDHIFCIIALDHCDPLQDDCLNRLAAISKACQARPNPVWFLFTISSTRPPAVLDHVSSIFLDKEQSMRTNLRKYLEEQVASLMRKHPIFKQFNIQTTDDSLAFGDHFSDVMLKLDSMDQFKVGQNTEEAKQHIERLSYKNDKFLQTVFDALSPHGLLILNWMSAANRPLSVSELVVALALDVRGKNTGSLEKYKTWSITEDIRYSLGSLVHFIEHDVHFCHATIRSQFEISKHFDPLFQDRVAQICVGYIFEVKERLKGLSNKQLEDLRASTPQQESPSDLAFAKYAIWSWPMHYQLSSKPSNLRQQVERLLDDEEIRSILSGVNRMYHIKPPENESNLCLSVILASKLGLEDIVVQLILQQMSTAGFQASLRQSLTEAAGEGHRALVRILLQQDVRPEEGILPACERGHVRVLRDILDANREDTKALSDIFEHSLLVAAKYGHSEVVRELLLRGTSPNTVDSSQAAALHYAARFGHEDIVQQLVNSKEIVLGAYDEAFYNPLQLAAEAGNAKIVEILSRPGRIGPSTCMGSISPPLHLASRHGHVEVVKALVAAGAKIHSIVNGETPLHLAARHGCLEVVKWLINHVGDDPNPDVDVPSAEPSKGPGSSPDPRESSVEKKQALENSDTPLTDGRAPPNSIDNVVLDFIAKKDLSGMTALHLAAMNGHVKVAKAITEAHQVSEVVNAVDDKKDTPLHLAAGHGYELIFGYLLSIGACVDAQNDTLCTPIHVASESRRLLVVKKLLQHRLSKQVGDWIHTSNVRGLTALSLAAEQGHRSIVKEILDYFHKSEGHDAWKPDDLKALHLAARGNHSEILTLLLQYNWDPNAVNNNGDTPLHSAVSNEEGIENVKRLLEAGSDPNRKNGSLLTPLYMAVEANYVNIAEAILTVGGKRVDPNLKCGRLGWTALHKASQQEKLTKLLLDHNADHCIKNNYGSTPLILASEVGNLDSVRFLLKAGADPRVKSSTGSTALHRAAQNDYLEVTKLLLERGALINEQRNDGTTPLYWATGRWSESPVLRFLLEKGANPNIYGGYYHSCLQAASWIGNSRSIECLLEWKADPNAVGGKFGSPLMAAVLDPSPHNVSLLLEKGANPNKLDSTGKSAMHSVCSMGGNVASTYIPMFLEYKGLLSTKDEGGSTPLIHAARWAGREVIQCLRTHSACLLDVDGCQRSALYWAATRDDPHALDTLLEWLGDEDELTRVNMRSTALHAAIINNKIDNFNKLLEKDVGFNGLDRNGWTPLALAIEYEREAMIKLLRAREAVEGLESQLPPTAWNKYDKSNLLGVDGTTVFVAGMNPPRRSPRAVSQPAYTAI
ncbi:ankyrin repeat-containing domain protein [Nemania diffusa]|nr:ankyrin repeat-containing domain protein [Nemania diffusa]